MAHQDTTTGSRPWWRSAVVYEVYPRSFADSDGDGIGDIGGIRAHLDHLVDLGVDALWITPWYPSPMHDAGYDVRDPRGIDPLFGDLAQATALVEEAHAHGIRILVDLVPNHVSSEHPWFVAALAAPPGSAERARFHFRDGRGPDGDEPPTDWISDFGGTAWSRTTDADGRPGQWYLHLYAPQQPDLNWDNPDVVADVDETLRFWFDLGVDGFRVDVAHGLVKDPAYTDVGTTPWPLPVDAPDSEDHPHWDRPGVHAIYRHWREIADSYDPPKVFAGEIWVGRSARLVRYLRPDELHTAFNFDYLVCPWRADLLRSTIDDVLASHAGVGAPPTWVLSNHDVPREVSRYARPQPDHLVRMTLSTLLPDPADFATGLRRARAAALLMLALPGSVYLYQGGELGLPEVEDIPLEALIDPIHVQTGGADRGRDGCRVPLPWSGSEPPYGFGPDGGAEPFLPQPSAWAHLSVEAQRADPASTLNLYRRAIALRKDRLEPLPEELAWTDDAPGSLVFRRGEHFVCLVNLGDRPVPLPPGAEVLLASDALEADGSVGRDVAVWLSA